MRDEDEGSTGSVVGPDGARLCARKCDTCIFRPGNLMHLRRGRVQEMVRDSLAAGSFITCHSTLPGTGAPVPPAICRGFFDAHGPRSNVIRIFGRIGGFDEVDPPSKDVPPTDQEG
jgi:hypothetical protein